MLVLMRYRHYNLGKGYDGRKPQPQDYFDSESLIVPTQRLGIGVGKAERMRVQRAQDLCRKVLESALAEDASDSDSFCIGGVRVKLAGELHLSPRRNITFHGEDHAPKNTLGRFRAGKKGYSPIMEQLMGSPHGSASTLYPKDEESPMVVYGE